MSRVYETLTVFGRDFHFEWECPGTWNDLSAAQLRKIIQLQQLGLPNLKYLALAVIVLLRVKYSLVKQVVLSKRLNDEYLLLADFLLDEKQYLTRNLIGRYRGFKTVSKWQEMVTKQYFIAETYLDLYLKTRDDLYLDHFMCAFYTKRKSFSEINEDMDYVLFKHWPKDVKLAVLTFYTGARQEFQANPNFKHAFKKGKGSSKALSQSLMKLRSQMAGNDLTKTNTIDATPLPEFFFQLNKDIEDAEQRSQQLSRRG